MRKIFSFLLLYVFMAGAGFGQIVPTGNGSVMTYDLFNARKQPHQKNLLFQPSQDPRVLQLAIEANGERKYTFLDGMPFAVYDKYLAMTSLHGKQIDSDARFPLLPIHQKIEAGTQWNFFRKGSASACGNWTVAYLAAAREGPDTSIKLDGQDIAVKTLLIEYRGDARSDRCDPYQQERSVWYAPQLNELLMDQWIEFTPGGQTSDFGYKWLLKSVATRAGPILK